jgi:hypothetical protein
MDSREYREAVNLENRRLVQSTAGLGARKTVSCEISTSDVAGQEKRAFSLQKILFLRLRCCSPSSGGSRSWNFPGFAVVGEKQEDRGLQMVSQKEEPEKTSSRGAT